MRNILNIFHHGVQIKLKKKGEKTAEKKINQKKKKEKEKKKKCYAGK